MMAAFATDASRPGFESLTEADSGSSRRTPVVAGRPPPTDDCPLASDIRGGVAFRNRSQLASVARDPPRVLTSSTTLSPTCRSAAPAPADYAGARSAALRAPRRPASPRWPDPRVQGPHQGGCRRQRNHVDRAVRGGAGGGRHAHRLRRQRPPLQRTGTTSSPTPARRRLRCPPAGVC